MTDPALDPDLRAWFGTLLAAEGSTTDAVVEAVDALDPEDRAAFMARLGVPSE